MKKIYVLLIGILLFLSSINSVKADGQYCTRESAEQLAKIVFRETGSSTAATSSDTFFMRISTAAVVINNANRKNGATFYEKLYNLTDSNYENYSTYKNKSFEEVVPEKRRGEFLYIAELVLTGKYSFPSNMTLQAIQSIVERWGTTWTYVETSGGHYDVYFGYEQNSLQSTDIYGNNITNTSPIFYRNLSQNFEKKDYSAYTVDTVCTGLSSSGSNGSSSGNSGSNDSGNNSAGTPGTENNTPSIDETNGTYTGSLVGVCANPGILRVIYFCLIIIDIIKVIIPIALIIFGLIDFSKSVVISDEKVQKKTVNLFVKRIISAVLVFAVPWIVEVVMVSLGNLTEKVNFTDCIENANSEKIKELEKNESLLKKTQESCILNGKAFLIRYYDKDNKKILETSAHCTGIPFKYKEISAAGFKGWTFKDKSDGTQIFRNGGMVNKDFYDKYINDYGSLDLVQVFE